MANNLTNPAEDRVLDWLNPDVTALRPTGPLKLRLYTILPNQETGTGGVSPTTGAYADTTITFNAAVGGVTANNNAVTFPTATLDWGDIVGMGVVDATGFLIYLGELAQSKFVPAGEAFQMPVGSISPTLTSETDNLVNTWENAALDWLLLVGTPTRPASPLRVRLYTNLPDQETGAGGTQVTGNGYADTTVVFDIASSGATANVDGVNFPHATGGDWGNVVGVSIRENSGSNVWVGAFNVVKVVNDGQTIQLPAGSVTLSLD